MNQRECSYTNLQNKKNGNYLTFIKQNANKSLLFRLHIKRLKSCNYLLLQ